MRRSAAATGTELVYLMETQLALAKVLELGLLLVPEGVAAMALEVELLSEQGLEEASP